MSGETESSISAWTTDVLKEHVDAMLTERDRRHADDLAAIRDYFNQQIQCVKETTASADDSIRAQTKLAFAASEKAIDKADTANEKRFDNANEFRGQLADQAATFMPRSEAEAVFKSMTEKIDDLRLSRSEGTGNRAGSVESRASHRDDSRFVMAIVGLGITIVLAAITVAGVVLGTR